MITREYLEGQLAHLTKQAEQASVTLHNANGAIAATRHLMEVLEKEAQTAAATGEASASDDQPKEAENA
jgi:hypothetical protein